MKPWVPITIALVVTVIINAFPFVMAFVLNVDGWAQTGWIFYIFTVPIGLLLIVVGLIATFVLYRRQKKGEK